MTTDLFVRVLVSVALLVCTAAAPPLRAEEGLAGLAFEQLGPAACEMPPAEVTPEAFNDMAAASPRMEAGAVRGRLSQAFDAELVGGASYGSDADGGLAVAVQGLFRASETELLTACVALVRLVGVNGGDVVMPMRADLVGEHSIDTAAPGSFLALVKFIGRDADGVVGKVGSGEVQSGTLVLQAASDSVRAAVGAPADIETLSGTLQLTANFRRDGDTELKPLLLEVSIPVAPRFLKTVPRLLPATP